MNGSVAASTRILSFGKGVLCVVQHFPTSFLFGAVVNKQEAIPVECILAGPFGRSSSGESPTQWNEISFRTPLLWGSPTEVLFPQHLCINDVSHRN